MDDGGLNPQSIAAVKNTFAGSSSPSGPSADTQHPLRPGRSFARDGRLCGYPTKV